MKKIITLLLILLILCGCGSRYKNFYNEAKNSDLLDDDGDGWYSSKAAYKTSEGKYFYYIKMNKDAVTVYRFEDNGNGLQQVGNPYFWANANGDDTLSVTNKDMTELFECYTIGLDNSREYKEIYDNVKAACEFYVSDISKYLK